MTPVPGRILIADDEDSLRWVLEKGLRQGGYEVTVAKDGPSALRAFELEEPFDLVFLDVRMPGMDGLAVLARLRELRPDVHVIVMTAHGTMDTAIQAMQRGAYDYLAENARQNRHIFAELSRTFARALALVAEACSREQVAGLEELLALYRRWLSTGDPQLAAQLKALGVDLASGDLMSGAARSEAWSEVWSEAWCDTAPPDPSQRH